jgi:large subunit ribosomal protein L5
VSTLTTPRLKSRYNDIIRPQLRADLGIDNIMEIPAIEKIVINMGVGRAAQQSSLLEGAVADLAAISGQKPVITKATKSIAGFKLREGQAIGCKVTLRGDRMWEFLDRLIAVAIPRIRDFRGLPAHSWDGRGNYTFGLSDQTVFIEIDQDRVDQPRGKALLDAFGFPFKRGADADNAPRKKKNRNPQFRGGKKK